MSLFVIPVSPNGGCCTCDRAIDACTCCPYEIGEDSYEENHGFDECPDVGAPCGSAPSPSCADLTIGPVKLSSPPFKTKCLDFFVPKAYFSIYADNYGSVVGKTTINYNDGVCAVISTEDSIEANVEAVNDTESRAFIMASAQNSSAGGPYALFIDVQFYLDNNDE
jgi:hypothetical protein